MIELKTYAPTDAKTVLSWINDEKTLKMWSRNTFSSHPITEDDLNSYYSAKSKEEKFHPMSFWDNEELVGHAVMSLDGDVARMGFIIIDPKLRGAGMGRKIVSLALDFAFSHNEIEKASLYVYDKNVSAYNCYVKLGFTKMPSEYDLCFDFFGNEWIFKLMSITREEYRSNLN